MLWERVTAAAMRARVNLPTDTIVTLNKRGAQTAQRWSKPEVVQSTHGPVGELNTIPPCDLVVRGRVNVYIVTHGSSSHPHRNKKRITTMNRASTRHTASAFPPVLDRLKSESSIVSGRTGILHRRSITNKLRSKQIMGKGYHKAIKRQ